MNREAFFAGIDLAKGKDSVIMLMTPNGTGNRFYELAMKTERKGSEMATATWNECSGRFEPDEPEKGMMLCQECMASFLRKHLWLRMEGKPDLLCTHCVTRKDAVYLPTRESSGEIMIPAKSTMHVDGLQITNHTHDKEYGFAVTKQSFKARDLDEEIVNHNEQRKELLGKGMEMKFPHKFVDREGKEAGIDHPGRYADFPYTGKANPNPEPPCVCPINRSNDQGKMQHYEFCEWSRWSKGLKK